MKITSFNGLNNASAAEAFREMAELMDSSPRVIIHRDRDFLTDEELGLWSEIYTERDIEVFCPGLSDTEAYHATAAHVAKVTGVPLAEAEQIRTEVVAEKTTALRTKFREKRRFANRKYLDGGAPRTDDLWPDGATPTDSVLYGKLLLASVEQELRARGLLDRGRSLTTVASDELRETLRSFLNVGVTS